MIAQFNLQSLAAIADGESQSQKPTAGAADRTLFELRKKKFNADFLIGLHCKTNTLRRTVSGAMVLCPG